MSGAGTGRSDERVALREVDEVRALLRSGDHDARRSALARIRCWDGALLDRDAAASVLRAVTVAYPWVTGERVDPADVLVRVLWACPTAVDAGQVEAAYHVSGERVRRSLLHLLALRRDAVGLASVLFLLGPEGPFELLPTATTALLDPLLDLDDLGPLPRVLAVVAGRPGWAWHASDLLRRMVLADRLAGPELDRVVVTMTPVLVELLRAVDRAASTRQFDTGPGGDLTREDRRRLVALVRFLESVRTPASSRLLFRVMASADPRAAAPAAVALCAQGLPVAPERLDLIAREAEPRALLLDGLEDLDLELLVPADRRTGVARAEADLVRWLAGETELGAAPDEVEHLATLPLPRNGATHHSIPAPARMPVAHLFRFRLRAPHWSSARGWMVGAAGSYAADGERTGVPFAHSLYRAEDELTPVAHLEAIRSALVGGAPPF